MPKPIYMICSESGAQDSTTGLASHFNVFEQIVIQKLPEGMLPRPLSFYVSALWGRTEDDDPECDYEFRIAFFIPPDNEEVQGGGGSLKLSKLRCRVNSMVHGMFFKGPGTFRAEVRLRRGGDNPSEWSVQTYEVPVVELSQSPGG